MKYSIIRKHPGTRAEKFYGRIREGDREKLVPIGRNRDEAERWLRAAERTQSEIEDLVAEGKEVPPELSSKLLTVDTPAFARKGLSKPASAPGGVLDNWEREMRLAAMRESTIEHYTRAARLLLGERKVDCLTTGDVRSIVGQEGIKPNTRRFYRNVLRSLFSFMKRTDLVDALPKIKYEQVDRAWWTEEEMDDIILNVTSDTAERTLEYKDYFRVMATIGSRQGETYLLRWKDLHDGCITFRAENTKSRKERVCPIPFDLWAQLEVRRKGNEDPVFPLVSPSQSRRYRVLRRVLDKLGLKGGLHTFRHSVSMILYRKCGDLKCVCGLLGHSPSVALEFYQNTRSVEETREKLFGE